MENGLEWSCVRESLTRVLKLSQRSSHAHEITNRVRRKKLAKGKR